VNERPILFNSEMVRAVLAGRKMQTRRVIKPQPCEQLINFAGSNEWAPLASDGLSPANVTPWTCPYGKPGDRLWVRETWAVRQLQAGLWIEFKADGNNARLPNDHDVRDEGGKTDIARLVTPADRWRPSIFMPRWASRITLEVSAVRVERVQSITEADAIAEGTTGRDAFTALWESINAKRGYGWAVNPWVWVVEFTRAQP